MTPVKSVAPLIFFLCTLLLLLVSKGVLYAQAAKEKPYFSSLNEIGLVTGEKGEALALQTTNGFQKGKTFAGIGVGLDYYGVRTLPLFASFRRVLTSNKNAPFVYTNAGLNFLWLSSLKKNELQAQDATPGYYYDLGVGWRLSGKNRTAFMVSAGYTVKKVQYKAPSYTIFSFPQTDGESFDRFNFLYRRLVIKIALQL